MQSFTHGLRAAARARARSALIQVPPHQIASSSRVTVQWDSRRFAWNPVDWISRQLSPRYRRREEEETVQEARETAKKSGEASLFEYEQTPASIEEDKTEGKGEDIGRPAVRITELVEESPTLHISHRKLNLISRQIAGKPIDQAILQMAFSEKRVAKDVTDLLAKAKIRAVKKGLDEDTLIVSESWANKGPGGKRWKELDIKGRMRFGVRKKYWARITVVLRKGLTHEQQRQKIRARKLRRIVSSGLVREDVPLRNPAAAWAW